MPPEADTVTVNIVSRWDASDVLYAAHVPAHVPEHWRVKAAVGMAVKDRASLDGASLDGAILDGASLDCARLVGASLDGASLVGASLDGASLDRASLVGARLDGASLDCASLDGASLVGASLDRASLDRASLVGARLDGASLVGASLVGARLRPIRADFWDVLLRAIPEVPGLLLAIREGRVDGSTYHGECACLVGTIANLRHVNADTIDYRDSDRPIEVWFMAIRKGDTPAGNLVAAITEQWIIEFQGFIAGAQVPA